MISAWMSSKYLAVTSEMECEAKFSEIQARYSACKGDAWFDELRKQRIAELKRELQKSESLIGSLQSVIESLSNSKHEDVNSGCHTESCSPAEIAADTNSSSKELSKDRSSAASFTEEASNSQKSQKVQNTSAETLLEPHVEKGCTEGGLLWGSRKKRGLRDKKVILMADDSSREGENTSTSCIQIEGSSEGRMNDSKTSKIEPSASVRETAKQKLGEILNSISSQGDCYMLQHQIDIQRKRARYKKMIRQHIDFRMLHSKIKSGAISSANELLKDMLVFVNNVLAFYPKATLEHMAAIELRGLVCKTLQQSSSITSMNSGEAGIASDLVTKKTAAGIASDPVIKKTAVGIAGDPLIKKTARGIAGDPVIKKTAAGITSGPVIKKTAAGIASDPVNKKTAAGISSDPVNKKPAAGVTSDPVIKKTATGVTSSPVIKKTVTGVPSAPVIKKTATGVASAPVIKKIARTMPPVRHVPRDAKRSKVPAKEAGSTASQGEAKDLPGDAAPSANEKSTGRSPPAKKRGVGRPPKSGQKRAAPQSQQDSPNKGRKRTRR
ncbi:uncharacterized protein LOC100836400 isoform X2 [Brachypodium distachyon]|uniref:Bromo domain-containing protein n=1 Tax=Brachypodium distachyon TaxID=15368 RepID=A0A0Q3KX20_BRADI|nr:uncharacterized protein LOC100836400 isoform X2 [Brachypodium distachyon]KQK15721.1 hypothetical protein BRADI_1g24580v3 [Brachypodium distachyon]|eukprot:XP_024312460.1 uncharacterized protein LOC100836400 isoform X2 [Brachypodium distachyon]